MNYSQFCKEARRAGVRDLLRETTEYKGLGPLTQLYAVKGGVLIGCYSGPEHGGKIFSKPKKRWSASGRKFEKVAI